MLYTHACYVLVHARGGLFDPARGQPRASVTRTNKRGSVRFLNSIDHVLYNIIVQSRTLTKMPKPSDAKPSRRVRCILFKIKTLAILMAETTEQNWVRELHHHQLGKYPTKTQKS